MIKHAVVVDDDESFLRFMTFCLAKGDFKVTPLTTGGELLPVLEKGSPDIVLLDRILPDINGFKLLEQIKGRDPNIPVLMFSTAGDADDVIDGLNIGADDYLPKPFSVNMLLAKVSAVCRRYQRPETVPVEPDISRGALSINEDTHEVMLEGDPLSLTKTEFKLLLVLAKNPGVVVERKDILENILGYAVSTESMENNIAFHVNALRRKLGSYRHYIETVRGFGYRFATLEES